MSVVVGAGCSRGCEADELLGLIDQALAEARVDALAVDALATIDLKAHEPGLVEVARRRSWPLRVHPAEALCAAAVPTPSAVVAAAVDTPSVAEAAALLSAGAGAQLVVAKRRSRRATCAIAHRPPGGTPP